MPQIIDLSPDVYKQLTWEELLGGAKAIGLINSTAGLTNIGGASSLIAEDLQSSNFKSGSTGWKLFSNGNLEGNDGNFRGDITGATGTFSGTITGGSLNIPDITTASSFHVDSSGNAWWGTNVATGYATAPAKILATGAATFSSITITGGAIDGTSTIGGRLASVLNTAIDASGHFADSAISTATGTIITPFTFGVSGALQIGTYSAGVTGDIRISPTGILGRDKDNNTTFSIDATTGVAVLNGLVVGTNVGLGTAQDSSGVTSIIGSTVTTSFVNALNITAASMSVGGLTAGSITSKAITLAVSEGTGDSYIAAGKTDFTNVDAGFILGIDDSDSNLAKFYIGNSSQYLNFDGTNLTATNIRIVNSFTAGETITGATTPVPVYINTGSYTWIIITSYEVAGNDRETIYGVNWVGQTFTSGSYNTTTSVKVWLDRSNSPAGNIDVSIYATSSNLPTGAALAQNLYQHQL